MTPAQLARIPDRTLMRADDTAKLREFLDQRGWRMTLLELDTERRRRRNPGQASGPAESNSSHAGSESRALSMFSEPTLDDLAGTFGAPILRHVAGRWTLVRPQTTGSPSRQTKAETA